MNSLTTRYRRSQLIALPVPGGAGPVQYRYAVRVSGHCVPVSYQLAQQMVTFLSSLSNTEAVMPPGDSPHILRGTRACLKRCHLLNTVRRNSSTAAATGGQIETSLPLTSKTFPWFFSAMFFICTKLMSKLSSPTSCLSCASDTLRSVPSESLRNALRILVFICSGRLAQSLRRRATLKASCSSSCTGVVPLPEKTKSGVSSSSTASVAGPSPKRRKRSASASSSSGSNTATSTEA